MKRIITLALISALSLSLAQSASAACKGGSCGVRKKKSAITLNAKTQTMRKKAALIKKGGCKNGACKLKRK